MTNLWAALWCGKGQTEHIINENCLPKLFRTKQECRLWIKEKYGYIKYRKDLREYPHGWRLPKPVKVEAKQIDKGMRA